MNLFENWVWGAPEWSVWALTAGVLLSLVVIGNYLANPGPKTGWSALAVALKLSAIGLLAVCLLQPMRSGTRPKPQANLFAVMVDNSASMSLQAVSGQASRGETVRNLVRPDANWRVRLAQDFDVRPYAFDVHLENVSDLHTLPMNGWASSLEAGLDSLAERFKNRPLAGVLLFTDGNRTDAGRLGDAAAWKQFEFPVYPVVAGRDERLVDARIAAVSVSRSDFETAPVTVRVAVEANGLRGQPAVVRLTDAQTDTIVQEQTISLPDDPVSLPTPAGSDAPGGSDRETAVTEPVDRAGIVTFRFRPIRPGVRFYRVAVFREQDRETWDQPHASGEITFKNNSRWLTVDGPRGPHRVLYLAGRPNWEFKFLRRALQEDAEIDLVGLLRIADKEAKFTFRDRDVGSTNPLFLGLDDADEETAQRYDEAVLIRLGVRDAAELTKGFPRSAEELFPFDAVILDDIEPEFFTQDQLRLLRRFVAERGGGVMFLGGKEAFSGRRFAQSPLGELSPLYPPRAPSMGSVGAPDAGAVAMGEPPLGGPGYRLELTREGMLQPWVRLRDNERAEADRIAGMPSFQTLSPIGQAKPGASVLAMARTPNGESQPAIAAQRFGRGRAVAIPLGDLWRWSMRRDVSALRGGTGLSSAAARVPLGDAVSGTQPRRDDPAQAWRQITRWLVNESPRRVECQVLASNQPGEPVELVTTAYDEAYLPVENATVQLEITLPTGAESQAGETLMLTAEADWDIPGRYVAKFWARDPGGYRVTARVTAEDASAVGEAITGWTADPAAAEFRELAVDRSGLEALATATGGELIDEDRLDSFVASLPTRKVPVSQAWVYPIWHRPWVMMLAIVCLCGEWGLRRWKGMP